MPDDQLLVVTGGETVHCGPTTRVRVLPALHSCLFAEPVFDSGIACLGDLDVSAQERVVRTGALFDLIQSAQGPVGSAFAGMLQRTSTQDGGPLSFLLTTTDGSVLVSGSTGHWRGIFEGLRPDVAMLSLTGRPNVNGEPYQGSAAQFMVEQVEALRPGRVAFCHHDPLLPGFPGFDIGAAAAALTERSPGGYFELEYATPRRLFRWPVSPVWGCHVWCSSRVCSTG